MYEYDCSLVIHYNISVCSYGYNYMYEYDCSLVIHYNISVCSYGNNYMYEYDCSLVIHYNFFVSQNETAHSQLGYLHLLHSHVSQSIKLPCASKGPFK